MFLCLFRFSLNYLFIIICNIRFVGSNVTTSIEKDQLADLEKNIIKRKAQLYDIEQTLPQKNGTYLKVRDFQQILYKISKSFEFRIRKQTTFNETLPFVCFHLSLFFFQFQIILGNVNVSILNRKSKYQYKDDYEKFKLILNGIGLFMAIINLSFNSR